MTVRDIVQKYLKDNGFDGLARDSCEPCGCPANDMCLCDSSCLECEPAHCRRATQNDIDNHSYDGDVGDIIFVTPTPGKE